MPAAANGTDGAAPAPGRRALVTVGTTRFDALVAAADSPAFAAALAAAGFAALVVQAGASPPPRRLVPSGAAATLPSGLRVEWFDYAPSLAPHLAAADLVVSHAGAGSLFEALRARKAVVAVPNPALMDDHQQELARALAAGRHLAVAAPEVGALARALRALDAEPPAPYPAGDVAGIVASIDELCGVAPRRRD
jgi:beta-1,4-N-acetylglucosaminyltransferase